MEQTIEGFQEILTGKYDHLPEVAFYMVGDISEVNLNFESVEYLVLTDHLISIFISKLTCFCYFMLHFSFFRSCKRQNDWPLKHHRIIFERLKLLVLQIPKSFQFLHYVTILTCKNRNGYNCQFFRQLKFSNAFTETNSKTLIV